MKKNHILEEVYKNRDALAKKHGFSVAKLAAATKENERKSSQRIVSPRSRPAKAVK